MRDFKRYYTDVLSELNMLYHRLTSESYEEAYRKHMDWRVKNQGREAVGGWHKGERQFEKLKEKGLKPEHKLLEIGCGTLRAGRFFIDYLHEENYYGMDVSPEAIEEGKKVIGSNFEDKKPNLIVNDDLQFNELAGLEFDYIHSIGVFTHIPHETTEEALKNIGEIMHKDSVFYVSFNIKGKVPGQLEVSTKSHVYEEQQLRSWASDYGLKMEIPDDRPMSSRVPQTSIEFTLDT